MCPLPGYYPFLDAAMKLLYHYIMLLVDCVSQYFTALIVTGILLEILFHLHSDEVIRGIVFFVIAFIVLLPSGKLVPLLSH